MTQPNLPVIVAGSNFPDPEPREIFLAEFGPDCGVRELAMDPSTEVADEEDGDVRFATRAVAQAQGIRLHRVIGPDRQFVTGLDPETERTDISFLKDRPITYLASARPGPDDYGWQITAMGVPRDDDVAPVLGTRPATPAEASVLDEMYPGWRGLCRDFDAREEKLREAAESRNSVRMEPPQPPVGIS